MRNFIYALVLVTGSSYVAFSCDACGCSGSLGNMGLGVQAQGNRTSFSFMHSYKLYNTTYRGLYGNPDTYSDEFYHRSELSGAVRLSRRFQARFSLPFAYNIQHSETNGQTIQSGLGDPQLGVHYFLIDSMYRSGGIVRWSAGPALKLPLGKFDDPESEQLMLNPGTGTFDVILGSSFAFRKGKFGVSNESSFTLRGTNKYDYHPGNTWYSQTVGLLVLNRFSLGTGISVAANATAKLRGEDYTHTNTQAMLLQNATVMAFSTNRWSFQLSVNTPIYQVLGDANSKQKQAFGLGVYYLFNQKQ